MNSEILQDPKKVISKPSIAVMVMGDPFPCSSQEKPSKEEEDRDTGDDETPTTVMSGFALVMLTIGMMTVAFLVALDHYILGIFQAPQA